MNEKKYVVIWKDYIGEEHRKEYCQISRAIRKTFEVVGWYKNGCCLRISDGKKVL